MWCSHHDLRNKGTNSSLEKLVIGMNLNFKLLQFFQLLTELCLDAQPAGGTIFSNEELSAFAGQMIVRAPHYIEIVCGCTNNRLGDSVGILKIRNDDNVSTTCHCNQNCNR
ncbi:putative developmental regulator, ULTRAPETALA [Helianthus anomalus]